MISTYSIIPAKKKEIQKINEVIIHSYNTDETPFRIVYVYLGKVLFFKEKEVVYKDLTRWITEEEYKKLILGE